MTRRLAVLLLLLAAACAPGGPLREASRQVAAGDLESARVTLERERAARPGSADVHVALGEVYYRLARDALDRSHDETRYLAFLERAVGEFVTAVEIDPRDERPHFFLAVMDTYRGDVRRALRGLENARRLRPVGVAYTNIAEVYVYLGQLHKARRWNELGLRQNAPYGAVLFNDMLIEWRQGDLDRARSTFAQIRANHPEMLREINVARLPTMPRSFEDFADYCCQSPACGPYMRDACRALDLDVRQREISRDTVLRELRIEMERERRMRQVYEQRKELEIEIGDPAQAR